MVPLRHRELVEIDGVAAQDVLLHRPTRHRHGRDATAVDVLEMADDVAVRRVGGDAGEQTYLLAVAERGGEEFGATTLAIALDRLEQEPRTAERKIDPRDAGDLLVPVDLGLDVAQLTVRREHIEPTAQARPLGALVLLFLRARRGGSRPVFRAPALRRDPGSDGCLHAQLPTLNPADNSNPFAGRQEFVQQFARLRTAPAPPFPHAGRA